jgi:hypothetical protein
MPDRYILMERRMRPVFVGFGYTSGPFDAIPAERDLRPDDDQGQPDDLIDRELLAEQDHTVEERKYRRQIVPERRPLPPIWSISE